MLDLRSSKYLGWHDVDNLGSPEVKSESPAEGEALVYYRPVTFRVITGQFHPRPSRSFFPHQATAFSTHLHFTKSSTDNDNEPKISNRDLPAAESY